MRQFVKITGFFGHFSVHFSTIISHIFAKGEKKISEVVFSSSAHITHLIHINEKA